MRPIIAQKILKTLVLTQESEWQSYFNQLWTAPELLRMTTRPINGTQKADVYSFAIVLQEIVFRAAPYFVDNDLPECTGLNFYSVFHGTDLRRGQKFIKGKETKIIPYKHFE